MKLIPALLRDCRASAAAEMALVLPGIAFIILNVVDLSSYLYIKMQVDIAAQEAVGAARVLCDTAAELPATQTGKCPSLVSTMQAAAQTTSLGANVSINTPTENYYCAANDTLGNPIVTFGSTVPANCSAFVTGSTAKPADYISVTASYTFSPVFPGASIAAVLPATINRTAWMRLQ